MVYKAFSSEEQQPFPSSETSNVSLSEDSPCASHLHFFTGIRSLGKVNVFDVNTPPSFAITTPKEIKYNWNFDGLMLPGQPTLTGEVYDGVFVSSADQFFTTDVNATSVESHQDIFRFAQSYLYRPDKQLVAYGGGATTTALNSSSSAGYKTDVIREINTRKDLFNSAIAPRSFRMQINNSNTSVTGAINGVSANSEYAGTTLFGSQTPNVSAFTTALDLKNPFGGVASTTRKSFFGVPVQRNNNNTPQTTGQSLDTIRTACTIEAIIRPFRRNTTVYFRRLTSGVQSGMDLSNSITQNKFMKLEITSSPDNLNPAFRFSIRMAESDADFTPDFAQADVQASGLFVPNDVGINLFDGQFHHIMVTWDIGEFYSGDVNRAELGAGVILGYIDNYKLRNREQVFPRLSGADGADGPTVQANMLENRIPVKTTQIYGVLQAGEVNPNNVYIGASNYNRPNGDTKGDIGALATQYDGKIEGLFDGQIQHLRIWNQRLKDGYTEFNAGDGQPISVSADAGAFASIFTSAAISYDNFHSSALTSTSAANIAGWWYFNNINGISGADIAGGLTGAQGTGSGEMNGDPAGNVSSNTGSVVGNGKVKFFDDKNLALGTSANSLTDLQVSAIPRDYLYFDQEPINWPVDNYLPQGRLLRNGIDNAEHRVGLVYYDLGVATMDGDDPNARLNFTYPASGTTGDMGFAVTGLNNTSFNFQRIVFDSQQNRATLLLNARADGDEMNYAGNPSGYSKETEEPVFDDPTTYITSVGLYNHHNDLLAIAKLAKPVKKDDAIQLTTQIKLDF